jgi:hypothetical protein
VPADGSVISVPKGQVPKQDVVISTDPAQREALRSEWKRNNELSRGKTSEQPVLATGTSEASARNPVDPVSPLKTAEARRREAALRGARGAGAATATEGEIPRVKLRDVPLRDALKATLRPLDLNYRVEDGYLWISTPEKLRTEPFERTKTRYFSLSGTSADTLPKIVLRNPAGYSAGPGGYGGYAGGYGGQGGYAGGYGGYGQGGYAGGYGGYGQGGAVGGYGGQGGYAGGYGGYGGGLGMGYRGGAQFSNIAELFTTIDDRLVGETPAVIGIGGLR